MAVLETGLSDLLRDGVPHSGGFLASATRETAEALLGWVQLDCNRYSVETFTKEVVTALDSVSRAAVVQCLEEKDVGRIPQPSDFLSFQ